MSTRARSRYASEGPAYRSPPGTTRVSNSRYETWTDQRDEITTNDAPAWQSNVRTETGYTRRDDDDDEIQRKSTMSFRAPPVEPSDSVSRVKSRPHNGREYSAVSKRTTVASRRPGLRSRYSSRDGSAWSRPSSGAPLTENNLERFNERKSQARSRTSKWTRADDVVSEDSWEDEPPQRYESRSIRRRTEVDESRGPAKSAYKSEAAASRRRSHANTKESQKSIDTEMMAAGAAAGAANQQVARRSRYAEKSDSQVSPRHVSPKGSTTRAANQDMTVAIRQSQAVTSRPSPPNNPYNTTSPTSVTSANRAQALAEMEWERQVRKREYRRPSDGRLVEDREILIRTIRPPQVPQVAGAA
jgi:hypothetical protein